MNINMLTERFSQMHLADASTTQTTDATSARAVSAAGASTTTTTLVERQTHYNGNEQCRIPLSSTSPHWPRPLNDLIYSYAYEHFLQQADGDISRLPTDIQKFIRRNRHTFTRLDLSFTHQTSGSLSHIARYYTGLRILNLSNITFNSIRICSDPAACRTAAGSDDAFIENRGRVSPWHSGITLADAQCYFARTTTLHILGATRVTSSGVSDAPFERNREGMNRVDNATRRWTQLKCYRVTRIEAERALMQLAAERRELSGTATPALDMADCRKAMEERDKMYAETT